MHAKIEVLLGMVIYIQSMQRGYKEENWKRCCHIERTWAQKYRNSHC
jgi:hypothetical protein